MSGTTLLRVPKTQQFFQQFKIRAELRIPECCDEYAEYEDLRLILQHSYSTTPWFWVEFYGLGTQEWIFDARLNVGARMLHRNFRRKIRGQILQSFEAHLSPDQFFSFQRI